MASTIRQRVPATADAFESARDEFDRIADRLPGTAWLEQPVDILIPAALEDRITEENVGRVHGRVRIVAESANAPTTLAADRILDERGVIVIPDVLANAGGATCSYLEQVQGSTNAYWRRDQVFHELDERLRTACQPVQDVAEHGAMSLRDGDADCPHDEAESLWREALETYGARAHEFAFLRTYGMSAMRHEDGLAGLRV